MVMPREERVCDKLPTPHSAPLSLSFAVFRGKGVRQGPQVKS